MRFVFPSFAMLIALATLARAESGTDHVKVDLLADTTAVQPGKPFTLGVRFRIDPGWHIYWTNPGDSGLPTRVKLDLPAGFRAQDVQYPIPSVLKLPGDITNYAYEHEVMLLVRIVPPATLPKQLSIDAQVNYLVCSENCLPGKGDVHLELVSGTATAANGTLFDTWTARLPGTPPSGLSAEHERKPAPADTSFEVRIKWPADAVADVKDVQWLPPAVPGFDMDDVHVSTQGDVTRLDFKLTQTGKEVRPDRADGLILYSKADGTRVGFPLAIYPSLDPHRPPRTDVFGSGS